MSNRKNGVPYVGVTNNLERRVWEHKIRKVEGFTQKYNADKLVHHEQTNDVREALSREKQLKAWKRQWKIDLVETENPNWNDLSAMWYGDPESSSG